MPVICIGPVCIPLNLLLPFIIGILHRWGYLQWFKAEWVTLRYWRKRCVACAVDAREVQATHQVAMQHF